MRHPTWSPAGVELAQQLDLPMAARGPASYQREFVERYVPNESWLMPQDVAEELCHPGQLREPQAAGTHARKAFTQLLVDLSWNSSRLEGNRYSRHAAENQLNGGPVRCDVDTVMLLNHGAAIEFLVDRVPQEGLSALVVQNLHAVLMQDLLPDSGMLGAIRKRPLGIAGTLYSPMQAPDVLERTLDSIVAKAALTRNPVEASLFLWVNLAYLQPFDGGNERVSRLAANIPLLLHHCAPLSFLDVTVHDHAHAMLGVYEFQDVALAVELFAWTYRRSLNRYLS
ncbi:Fic family protein [Ralstonia pseudosolanacearum]|uniref:Fic family protein n=1 Tax=Ralstonia pseudosolanacearum TaxID=1310165 RepID=UPI002676C9FD|nr:Fic family protein [Ralstonia pseudosolanacearum]MDO3525218.1 Fic family protein [Ralstonia pseudosolanacearum]MDO3549865.1 Fic family protein [Ralstonia pseudosolanacearum]MDO3554950.1 Fic family protein [Ralstonia pseudosolanacearum]MDO3569616.1 Fic family protein [Ralstonia pseudosolanacearum]MDO3584448.1 Fic family protein [Ralstonia pseudosolanacearum]